MGETIRHFSYFLITILSLLLLIEGVSSVVLFSLGLASKASHKGSERIATQYDSLLGWSHVPGIRVKDMFGPGIDVNVNSQGFRAEREFPVSRPADRARVVCSGDSFTYGYGVKLEESWCARLRVANREVEAINMAQIGYGLDQMYLWYQRDGALLEHDYLIVSTIFFDFTRMLSTTFEGFGKPTLKLGEKGVEATNVPVPRLAYFLPWVTRNWRLFRALKFVELTEGVGRIFFPPGPGMAFPTAQMEPIVARLIRDFRETNLRKHSQLVWVYLPAIQDLESSYTEGWRAFLFRTMRDSGIVFLDLTADFQKLSSREVESLFIPDGAIGYPGAGGHYSVRGNAFVAELISSRLFPPSRALILPADGKS